MRLALFSPLPPLRSGIADYTAALVEPLSRLAEVETFGRLPGDFDASLYDAIIYQVGNNPHHGFVYEAALRWPGVAVLHEANLHHLIAELTIRRGDWDAYLAEAEYNGGREALERARRVRALELGPDYDNLPMTRRLLERSRAAIVHSRAVEQQLRAQGFTGPVARIPHGAWLEASDRPGYRARLGIDETTPLIGVFGFLKPYKRIAQSLRAFRRLWRLEPRARMILAGEPHPDLPLESLIRALDLSAAVRVLGFTPIEDFNGYLAATDIVLNLRYPTVGESSGTLLRALGMGRPVIVSDVGSFRELPAEICLKAPVDASEEDFLFEYMNLLVARPALARQLGERARRWVERECAWEVVARHYVSFLEALRRGEPWSQPPRSEAPPQPPRETVSAAYIQSWAPPAPESRAYIDGHLARLETTLAITPPGGPGDRVLEMGVYFQITPALRNRLGYGEVRGCYYGPPGKQERRRVASSEGEEFACQVDLFDAERDRFPYPDGHFATVLCCELIEHLERDPMHMMAEINRVLRPGGHLVLTTPNAGSLRAIRAILEGFHPGFFPAYIRPAGDGKPEARHNREYTPREVARLLEDSGFEVAHLGTGPFREEPRPEDHWVLHLLGRYRLSSELRGDDIFAVGRKSGAVRFRYPSWLYSG